MADVEAKPLKVLPEGEKTVAYIRTAAAEIQTCIDLSPVESRSSN